jgi:hypothetical protein
VLIILNKGCSNPAIDYHRNQSNSIVKESALVDTVISGIEIVVKITVVLHIGMKKHSVSTETFFTKNKEESLSPHQMSLPNNQNQILPCRA